MKVRALACERGCDRHGVVLTRALDWVLAMYELLGAGIANIVQLKYLIPLTIGTLVGVIGGALPGVTITMTRRVKRG